MLQSGNGETHRNFELLVSEATGTGIAHVSRDGDGLKWSKVTEVQGSSLLGQPAIAGTSFNRDFHAVGVDKDQVLKQWAYSQSEKKWSQVSTIEGKDIDGFPGLTQSDGSQLVVVVKHADGTLNEVSTSLHSPLKHTTNSESGNNPPTAQPGPSPTPRSPATSPRADPPSSNPTSA
jgi:hypothetical protein